MKRRTPIRRNKPLPKRQVPIARKVKPERGNKKTGVNDKVLWKWFSIFIRLRDSDEQGVCKCFTCNVRNFWQKMDCGHGVPRQHMATKYNEKNNHAQCGNCNFGEGGRRETYKEEMNKRYGAGTWEMIELLSKKPNRVSQFEVDMFTKHYEVEARKLAEKKRITLK